MLTLLHYLLTVQLTHVSTACYVWEVADATLLDHNCKDKIETFFKNDSVANIILRLHLPHRRKDCYQATMEIDDSENMGAAGCHLEKKHNIVSSMIQVVILLPIGL